MNTTNLFSKLRVLIVNILQSNNKSAYCVQDQMEGDFARVKAAMSDEIGAGARRVGEGAGEGVGEGGEDEVEEKCRVAMWVSSENLTTPIICNFNLFLHI